MSDERRIVEAVKKIAEAEMAYRRVADGRMTGEPLARYAALQKAIAEALSASSSHWSDCAVHNEPAMPNGACDCGGDAPRALSA